MRPVCVLLWKHAIVRKRRLFHTFFELLYPLIFPIALILVRSYILNFTLPPTTPTPEVVRLNEPYTINQALSPIRVIYTPETDETTELMSLVAKKLNLPMLQFLPEKHVRGIVGVKNTTEIGKYSKQMGLSDAAVLFENLTPDLVMLNYTIRMKINFMSSIYKPQDENYIPHESYGGMYESFLRLQWAIDTSYIEMATGSPVQQQLSLQEFPYKEKKDVPPGLLLTSVLVRILTPMLMMFVYSLHVGRLVDDRCSGVMELVKMIGVTNASILASHLLNIVPGALIFTIVTTVLLKIYDPPLISETSPVCMVMIFLLFYFSVVGMAHVLSFMLNSPSHVTVVCVLAYVGSAVAAPYVAKLLRWRAYYVLVYVLAPHCAFISFWDNVIAAEKLAMGVTMSTLWRSFDPQSLSAGACLVCLALQLLLYVGLTWYLMHVAPGPHGQRAPWDFCLPERMKKRVQVGADEELPLTQDPKYFEPVAKEAPVGIHIENVSKWYKDVCVLQKVNLEVLKGSITILLGHNGAGKTTLMNIITGMSAASEGRVLVAGADVSRSPAARHGLGYCPQHNLFFGDLTVREHVIFFTILKGASYKSAQESSTKLLTQLGIEEKKNAACTSLSGGMKRRLQLACALAHDSSVLILDEPTSGLDVQTRRDLWDLILSFRGRCTVLLTTHFMEEADTLGDRVAALHAGHLRCHASPMFLKRAVGSGSLLSVTTSPAASAEAITSVIHSYAPDATLDAKPGLLNYTLPQAHKAKFPNLFRELETRKEELGIQTIGVMASTLDTVFLRLCSDTSVDEEDGALEPLLASSQRIVGWKLYARIFKLLFIRNMRFYLHKPLSTVLNLFLLPWILFVLGTWVTNETEEPGRSNARASLSPDLYRAMPDRRLLYNLHMPHAALRTLKLYEPRVGFEISHDVLGDLMELAATDPLEYNKYLAGVELNETNAKVLYTTVVRHAAPVALSLLSNLLLEARGGRAGGIAAANHPAAGALLPSNDMLVTPRTPGSCALYVVVIAYSLLMVMFNAVTLVMKERVSSTRLLHLMSGCPAWLHWVSSLAAHLLVSLVCFAAPLILCAFIAERSHTLDNAPFAMVLLLVLVVGTLASLAVLYFITFLVQERTAFFIVLVLVGVFILLTPTAELGMLFLPKEPPAALYVHIIGKISNILCPFHALTMAIGKLVYRARLNAYCNLNRAKCPDLVVPEKDFSTATCCNSEPGSTPFCYLCFEQHTPLPHVLVLLVQAVVFMVLVLMTEYGMLNRAWDWLRNCRYSPPAARAFNDPDVRAEEVYVDNAIQKPAREISDVCLVQQLRKRYRPVCGRPVLAVSGLSFSVKKGECFGLLGVNGAGKSTTFKMLTNEECATRGQIFINGYFNTICSLEYLRTMSYCPQFFGLDEFQTGRQNLLILLKMRGLSDEDADKEAESWIVTVGLQPYSERKVSGYSGGCRRRLAAGAALAAAARLALLDEPTAGVDPVARRRVWAAARRAMRAGRSVVLTSHSMDEIESLCSRVMIVSRGEACALGSPPALRATHGSGHKIVLKINQLELGSDAPDGEDPLTPLKAELLQRFNDCTLKDEHASMLQYLVRDRLQYSELFSRMEQVQAAFPLLLQDYSVSETTLEEVFLSYAKDNTDDKQTPPV